MKNSNKFLAVAVLLLLLVNIALVALLVTRKGRHGEKRERLGPFDMMEKELNMTDAQIKEFEQLRDDHLKRIRPKYDSIRELKATLFSLPKSQASDSIITFYVGRISELQAAGNRLSYEHFQEVRKLFNDDQQKRYDTFIQKMMQRQRKKD